jgi:hypothetical protein
LFDVTVEDTRPPTLRLPGDLVIEATGPDGAPATFAATAQDAVDGDVPVAFDFPSGGTFALGTTVVTASGVDRAGNRATGTFVIVVQDTTAPALTLPRDIAVETNDAAGRVVEFAASARDVVSGTVAVLLSPPSGSHSPWTRRP